MNIEDIEKSSEELRKLCEEAFVKNVHENLRLLLTVNEKELWINGYLCGLISEKKEKA